MSDTPVSNFGDNGVDVARPDRNMTYLYGLSDFFTFMFEDEETTNLLLEANALTSSEVYSRFLQLTSSLSLESIQTFTSSSIKLILLQSSDKDPFNALKFKISSPIEDVGFVSNRPFLPTESLENGVDFEISRNDISSSYIQFARPIEEYKLSSRINSKGATEYALWMTDVVIDEQLVQKSFGNLLGLNQENSSDTLSNFIYGLYYVYTNGPTLGLLKRGLNLVLGAQLARDNEVVLDIRNYLDTDQYLIVTDQNQYLLPFGLKPSVSVGNSISVGDLLAEWIELKDYIHDGEWWLNASIPPSIIKNIPYGQADRFAIEGSPYDFLMKNYLYKNTFLVRVRVDSFKNVQNFLQITDIINKAKPTHTQPVYVWLVPSDLSDNITLIEQFRILGITLRDFDFNKVPAEFMKRDNTVPLKRGQSIFLRSCVPENTAQLIGEDIGIGSTPQIAFDEAGDPITVTGVRAYRSGASVLNEYEKAWVRAISFRGNAMWNGLRGQSGFLRGIEITSQSGTPVLEGFNKDMPPGSRAIGLHTTRKVDLSARLNSVGLNGSLLTSQKSFIVSGSGFLISNYNQLFTKGANVGGLGPLYPRYSYEEFIPGVGEVFPSDYLYCKSVSSGIYSVYWITSNRTLRKNSTFHVGSTDPVSIKYTNPMNRQSMLGGTSYYLTRGGALTTSGAIVGTYSDVNNTSPVSINRSGATLTHVMKT